ncbi:MAG TPA: hypothetical protein VJO53_12000 [Candidatus Acidoferrales bacterium]|nr:hypothetical protein [Candidatus Acidoferrales bacterium]
MTGGKKAGRLVIGACVLLALLLTTFWKFPQVRFWASRARPWNASAIQTSFAGVQVREIDSNRANIVLFYDLDNKTDTDYRLASGPNVVIMCHLRPTGSLSSDLQVGLETAVFVPAGNRARIALTMNRPFSWPAQKDDAAAVQFRQFVNIQLTGVQGFVIFDQKSRYQIELPVISPELQPNSTGAEQDR